jgi:hypothetical protein
LPGPYQELPDSVGLPLINGGGAFPGDYLDLEPDFDPARSFFLIKIIADNAPRIDLPAGFTNTFLLVSTAFLIIHLWISGIMVNAFMVAVRLASCRVSGCPGFGRRPGAAIFSGVYPP